MLSSAFNRPVDVDLTQDTDEEVVLPKKRSAYIDLTLDSEEDIDTPFTHSEPLHRAKKLRISQSPPPSSDSGVPESSRAPSFDLGFAVSTGSVYSISSSPEVEPSTHTQLPDDMLLKMIDDTNTIITRKQAALDSCNDTKDYFNAVKLRNEIIRAEAKRAEYIDTLLSRDAYRSENQETTYCTQSEPGPSCLSWDLPAKNTFDIPQAQLPIPSTSSVTNLDSRFDIDPMANDDEGGDGYSSYYGLPESYYSQSLQRYARNLYDQYPLSDDAFYMGSETQNQTTPYKSIGHNTTFNQPSATRYMNQDFGNYNEDFSNYNVVNSLPYNLSRFQKPHGEYVPSFSYLQMNKSNVPVSFLCTVCVNFSKWQTKSILIRPVSSTPSRNSN
jgi:hypothetical protein